ncbi:hypothetical protein SUGI_1123090 [Cryptomeria japonica]|nr:hypothetical protein SUGI_1123090 [Cryptomeria japonica]
MLSAGSDTSSVALEWALSLLLQHPNAMGKAQEELDSKVGRNRMVQESDIPQLSYLQAIERFMEKGIDMDIIQMRENCYPSWHLSLMTKEDCMAVIFGSIIVDVAS